MIETKDIKHLSSKQRRREVELKMLEMIVLILIKKSKKLIHKDYHL